MTGLGKFIVVGGLATLLQYLVMVVLIEYLNFNEVIASSLGFTLSAIFNYLTNYYLTFKSQQKHTNTLPKFILTASVVLLLNTMLFTLFFIQGLQYLLAQILTSIITLLINFTIHKYWIYRK